MKPIKLEKSRVDGKYFRVRASDLVDALKELLMYYPGELLIVSPDTKFTLKNLLAFAHEMRQQYSEAILVLAIDDFNFLNELYKNRKSMLGNANF